MALDRYWYSQNPVSWLLAPLGWLYCAITHGRRWAYGAGLLPVSRIGVPVIVVGNVTVGGTGKTPLVIWLVERLRASGWRPGVVSRGYGGQADRWPQWVSADSDPEWVGDEPVLVANRCACPVAVGPDRVQAANALLERGQCDIVVSDDGLQHFALGRDLEIAVVDGTRRFGNGRCIPAGPLRESLRRLEEVDFVVANGAAARLEYAMHLHGDVAVPLRDGSANRPLAQFCDTPVHAVAGIGDPRRFFSHLRRFGMQLIEHPFPDHYRYRESDLAFGDHLPVLMTEKDAVKCRAFAAADFWQVPVSADLDPNLETRLLELLTLRSAPGAQSSHRQPDIDALKPE